jgi:hypothetical protein
MRGESNSAFYETHLCLKMLIDSIDDMQSTSSRTCWARSRGGEDGGRGKGGGDWESSRGGARATDCAGFVEDSGGGVGEKSFSAGWRGVEERLMRHEEMLAEVKAEQMVMNGLLLSLCESQVCS